MAWNPPKNPTQRTTMLDTKLTTQIEKLVTAQGYALFDIEVARENENRILRICIHHKDGIKHSDCQKVSDLISPLLDVYEPFDGAYLLEVSSPGLERILSKPQHFACFVGQKVQITLKDKSKITGILESANETHFAIDSAIYTYSDIKKAKSIFEWN